MSCPPGQMLPILAVNDDPDFLRLFELILARNNYKMIKALSGQEALAICRTQAVALIVPDTMMPGMDGFEVYKALQSDQVLSQIPVLFGAPLGKQMKEKVRQLGIMDYLDFPCTPQEILAKVRDAIDKPRLSGERCIVTLQNEATVVNGSEEEAAQRRHWYEKEILLGEIEQVTSAHGINCVEHSGSKEPRFACHSCIVLAAGGPTGVHHRSAVLHDDQCILAIGPFLAALQMPFLEMAWYTKVDWSSNLGVYHVPEFQCYITHGECDVTRVSYTGQVIWTRSGGDIFTNGFALYGDYLEVIDWNNEKYRIELRTGHQEIVRNDS